MQEEQSSESKPTEVKFQIGGPILIKGNFRFRDSSGKITEGEQELYICGCGGSASKPWCDCSHKNVLKKD